MSRRRPSTPDVRNYFDRQSPCYLDERYVRPSCDQLSYQTRRRLTLDLLGSGPGRLLDVGSGPGILAGELVARGYTVCEADVSFEMLRESRRRLSEHAAAAQVTFVEGRLPDLPFADGSFTTVACIGVFAYLEDAARSLREIRRLLKPDGVLVMQVSNALCPTARLHTIVRRGYRRLGEALGGPSYPHLRIPLASFHLGSLRRLLARERFHVDSWAHYDFRPPFLEWVAPSAALAVAAWLQRFERSSALGQLSEGIVLRARSR